MPKIVFVIALAAGAAGAWLWQQRAVPQASPVAPEAVLDAYDTARAAAWVDAMQAASLLRAAVGRFLSQPEDRALDATRAAWRQAQESLWRAESFWELDIAPEQLRRLSAWPIDEGLFDYVSRTHYESQRGNAVARANIVRNELVLADGAFQRLKPVDLSSLDGMSRMWRYPGFVPLGIHPLEFMLWGQAGPTQARGQRRATDYRQEPEHCTSHAESPAERRTIECLRRAHLLQALAAGLHRDLEDIVRDAARAGPPAYRSNGARFALGRLLTVLSGRLRELADQVLVAGSPAEQPNEFSGETVRYLRGRLAAIRSAWRLDDAAFSLRNWARAEDADRARKIDRALGAIHDKAQALDSDRGQLLGARPEAQALRALVNQAAQAVDELVETQTEGRSYGVVAAISN